MRGSTCSLISISFIFLLKLQYGFVIHQTLPLKHYRMFLDFAVFQVQPLDVNVQYSFFKLEKVTRPI